MSVFAKEIEKELTANSDEYIRNFVSSIGIYNYLSVLNVKVIEKAQERLAANIFAQINRESVVSQAKDGKRQFLIFEGGNFVIDLDNPEKSTGVFTVIPKSANNDMQSNGFLFSSVFDYIGNRLMVSEFSKDLIDIDIKTGVKKLKKDTNINVTATSFDNCNQNGIINFMALCGRLSVLIDPIRVKIDRFQDLFATDAEIGMLYGILNLQNLNYIFIDCLSEKMLKMATTDPAYKDFKGFDFTLNPEIVDMGDLLGVKICVYMRLARLPGKMVQYRYDEIDKVIQVLKQYKIVNS